MGHRYWTKLSRALLVFVVIAAVASIPGIASASCTSTQQSCSTSYGVDQTYFGSGGQLCDAVGNLANSPHSTNYCANTSLGELGVGNPSSTHYQTRAGSALSTNREPSLAFSVGGASTYLGDLKTSCTTVTTGNFNVKTYLAGSYIVITDAAAPTSTTSSPHTLSTPSTPTAPSAGTEQFGMNLVSNTGMSPANCDGSTAVGANPLQVPDSTFSFGAAATSAQNGNSDSYNTAGKFMYNNGDVIAFSSKSSGETDYTISFIYNISNVTPTGFYVFNDVLVATSTY